MINKLIQLYQYSAVIWKKGVSQFLKFLRFWYQNDRLIELYKMVSILCPNSYPLETWKGRKSTFWPNLSDFCLSWFGKRAYLILTRKSTWHTPFFRIIWINSKKGRMSSTSDFTAVIIWKKGFFYWLDRQ